MNCGGELPVQSPPRLCPRLQGHVFQITLSRGVPQRFHLEENQWAASFPL